MWNLLLVGADSLSKSKFWRRDVVRKFTKYCVIEIAKYETTKGKRANRRTYRNPTIFVLTKCQMRIWMIHINVACLVSIEIKAYWKGDDISFNNIRINVV
ncbi:hypothetical protein BIU88_08275 [Chlorobaculum limnaeum]|uniref:Uncharacterized protein n=1 Tax=Chlorobaculum limnaeum TaxID=274537 RepID=A0A1D8D4I3_CHLLM|nr:hypothetical protein BIU88_08275 [Chlorobaculum limnaeum]